MLADVQCAAALQALALVLFKHPQNLQLTILNPFSVYPFYKTDLFLPN